MILSILMLLSKLYLEALLVWGQIKFLLIKQSIIF